MFTKAERRLIRSNYFTIIRETEDYIEFKSNNTKHCWIIHKHYFKDNKGVYIYHKHSINQPYYHQHWKTYNVKTAVVSIKNHDTYVLRYAYH